MGDGMGRGVRGRAVTLDRMLAPAAGYLDGTVLICAVGGPCNGRTRRGAAPRVGIRDLTLTTVPAMRSIPSGS
jgi:hypothetical protein